jgi:hypothetical protein
MKIFNVIHDDNSLKLETSHTKFESLERMMMVATKEFVKKGKVEKLRRILSKIEALLV